MEIATTRRLAQSAIEIRGRLHNSPRDAARLALQQAGFEYGYGGVKSVIEAMKTLKPEPRPIHVDMRVKMCPRLPYPDD